jgi:hypothetical protein
LLQTAVGNGLILLTLGFFIADHLVDESFGVAWFEVRVAFGEVVVMLSLAGGDVEEAKDGIGKG